MSAELPTNFDEYVEHVFMRLGSQIIDIEMTKDQARIAARDAITKFVENHYQSTNKAWLKIEITEELVSSMKMTLPDFVIGVDTVLSYKANDYLYRTDAHGTSMWSMLAKNYFGQTFTLSKVDIYLYERELSEWETVFQPMPKFTYDSVNRELTIEGGNQHLRIGNFMMLRVSGDLTKLDGPIWQNSWLCRYGEALFRIRWGSNFAKFSEVVLAGGSRISAGELVSQGERMRDELHEELYENAIFETGILIG